MTEKKESTGKSGGKSPRKPKKMALSEFIDSAGVNSRDTAVSSTPGEFPVSLNAPEIESVPKPRLRPRPVDDPVDRPSGIGRMVEKALANPTLVIAGLAAVPVLLILWGVTRRRKKPREEEEQA